jgi:hypothetical protein
MAIVVLVGLVVFVFVLVMSAAKSVEVSGAAVVIRCRLSAVVAAAFVPFSVVGWAAVAFWKSGRFCASRAAVCVDDRWTKRKCCRNQDCVFCGATHLGFYLRCLFKVLGGGAPQPSTPTHRHEKPKIDTKRAD